MSEKTLTELIQLQHSSEVIVPHPIVYDALNRTLLYSERFDNRVQRFAQMNGFTLTGTITTPGDAVTAWKFSK
jgi:hypothetical protein